MANPIPKYTGPIAIIDMLGFKKYVETNSLDDVISNYAHVLTGASFTSEVLKEDLQFMVYSDTIAIRLVNLTEKGFYNFCHALQIITQSYFYKNQIPGYKPLPIRGAIAIGEYSWHNGDISTQAMGREPIYARSVNFIVGQAIIDAHDHEMKQQWIGMSMNNRTAEALSTMFPNAFSSLIQERYLLEYDIPCKSGSIKGYAVNPTQRALFKGTFEAFCNKCDEMFQSDDELYETKLKYYNTLVFLNAVHAKDDLYPYISGMLPENRQDFVVKIDKGRYTELTRHFEDQIKDYTLNPKPETRNAKLET